MDAEDMVMGIENEYGIAVLDKQGRADHAHDVSRIVLGLATRNQNGFDNSIGGRFYRDGNSATESQHDHFEGCTPECAGENAPGLLALYNRALDRLMLEEFYAVCREMYGNGLLKGLDAHLIKDTTDWKGHCYGAQLNIRIPASLKDLSMVAEYLAPYLASKGIWAGQGGIRPTIGDGDTGAVQFVFSPRLMTFTCLVSSSTLDSRPYICSAKFGRENSYDLPHWSRLQLLCDPHLSDIIAYVDAGMTALIMRLLASGGFSAGLPHLPKEIHVHQRLLSEFLIAARAMNQDPSLTARIDLAGNFSPTALEIQKQYLAAIYESEQLLGLTAEDKKVLQAFAEILKDLEENPLRLADRSPCWLLYKICKDKLNKCGTDWEGCHNVAVRHRGKNIPLSRYLAMVAHQFPGLDEWGIWPRMVNTGRVRTLFSEDEVAEAAWRPPDSRASFRKKLFDRARELRVYVRMHNDSWAKVMFGLDDSRPSMELPDPTGRTNNTALRQAENIMQSIVRRPLTNTT